MLSIILGDFLLGDDAFCFRKLQTGDEKGGIFTAGSHSKHIIICLSIPYVWLAPERKAHFVYIYILRAMWWPGYPEMLCKEFTTCQNPVKPPVKGPVIWAPACKWNFWRMIFLMGLSLVSLMCDCLGFVKGSLFYLGHRGFLQKGENRQQLFSYRKVLLQNKHHRLSSD